MPSSSPLKKYVLALVSLTAATLLLAAGSASAAVPDAPWSASGTGTVTLRSDGTGGYDPAFKYSSFDTPTGTWTFSATAKTARTQPITWSYDVGEVALIEKFVSRGGKDIVKETLASNFPGPASVFHFGGGTIFELQPGDVYGFRMAGSNEAYRKLTGGLLLQIPDVTPPTITPTVTGTLGKGGYYTSDVKLAWKVEDPEGLLSTTGCDDAGVTADTAGRTFTCTARSMYGKVTATQSVTIKRDATAPALTVPGTIVKEGAGADGAAVDYAATATDTLDTSPRLACSPASGTRFALGTTKVTCTASDAAGHSVTKDFEVIVLRGTDPAPAPAPDPAPTASDPPAAAPSVTEVHMGGPVTVVQAPPAGRSINAVLAFRFTATTRITRLKALTVKNLPAGSTVTVTCAGTSCPKGLKGRTVARRIAKTSLNISSLVKGPLKPGTVITVVITSPDAATATKRLTVRKGKAPQVTSK